MSAIQASRDVQPVRLPGQPGAGLGDRRRLVMIASLVFGAIVWEILGRFVFTPIFFASFSRTVVAFWDLTVSGEMLRLLGQSMSLFVSGFAIGTALGLVFGIIIGRSETIGIALEDYVTVAYITPPIVIVPFVLAFIGLGYWPKVLVVVSFVFFPVCITTIEGARSTPKRLVEVAHSFCATRLQMWRDVVIPATVPYSMSGIRQGIARGLVGMVAAEFLLDASGVGQALQTYVRLYRRENLFAIVLAVLALGLLSMAIGRYLERRFAAWRQ